MVVVCAVLSTGSTGAHELAGTIHLGEGTGMVYLFLITEEEMRTPMTGVQEQILVPDADSPFVEYRFTGITTGEYAVRPFQDCNGDGRLNRGLLQSSEPWALSWNVEPRGTPRFHEIAFEIKEDLVRDFVLTR